MSKDPELLQIYFSENLRSHHSNRPVGIPIGMCNRADPHHIDHVTQSTGGGHSQQELEHVILILLYLKQT